jgi:hypothetical protein
MQNRDSSHPIVLMVDDYQSASAFAEPRNDPEWNLAVAASIVRFNSSPLE